MKRSCALKHSIFASCILVGLSASLAAFAEPTPVKIGVISPVTGPVALDGESFRHGAMLAAKTINAAGGVNGSQLYLVIEDGECKPGVSASAAQKLLVRDQVPVLVGAHCSPGDGGGHSHRRTSKGSLPDRYFKRTEPDGNAARMVLSPAADRGAYRARRRPLLP